MSLPLLQTKLYVPSPRMQPVQRAHLLAHLHDQRDRPLTLVAAPAGFGKTTLVSLWLAQRNQAVAWISLDGDDNDPLRFLSYLLAAIQTHHPQVGEAARQLLIAPQPTAPKTVLTLLLNDLSALTTALTLVLDDYHLIHTPAIHEALIFLIDHLPPRVQLIITSRVDPPWPLSRWRVRNQLTEIRADDLRFTSAEATLFLNERSGLQLTSEQIATLAARTEGWIAGLQLAALSLQGRNELGSFIANFTGSNAYIIDYLVEEVLLRQPEAVQHFLLQTSLLERLCGSLCDALTGHNDGQAMLEQLQRAHLFLIALDDERHWYRYHHLFAEVLQARLQQSVAKERITALQRRASQWFEQQNLRAEAINYALAGLDYEHAINLIEIDAIATAFRGQASTLQRWLQLLPSSLFANRPRLHIAKAAVGMSTGDLAHVEEHLQAAEAAMPTASAEVSTNHTLATEIMAIRAVLASFTNAFHALPLTKQALSDLPEQHILRLPVTLGFAQANYNVGEVVAAEQTLLTMLAQLAVMPDQRLGRISALTALGVVRRVQGKLQAAQQLIAAALQLADHEGQLLPMGPVFLALSEWGVLLYQQNQLAEASAAWQQCQTLSQQKPPFLLCYQAWLQQAAGNLAAAVAHSEQACIQAQTQDAPLALRFFAAWRVRLWLQQGNVTAAAQWADQQAERLADPVLTPFDADRLALVRAWLAQKDDGRAEPALAQMIAKAEQRGLGELLLEALGLQALMFYANSQPSAAFASLAHALTLAAPESYIRLFVDEGEAMRRLLTDFRAWLTHSFHTAQQAEPLAYVDRLLAAFPTHQQPGDHPAPAAQRLHQNLIEPLSERELEILRLVNHGLSNREIAEQLIVTVGTVKKHLNNIFGKLGATSRTQALVQARQVNLL